MKPRKVLLSIEITTDTHVFELRKAQTMKLYLTWGQCLGHDRIDQIQVNVVQPAKTAKKGGT